VTAETAPPDVTYTVRVQGDGTVTVTYPLFNDFGDTEEIDVERGTQAAAVLAGTLRIVTGVPT
jgi:hypothetical protein